MKKQKIIIKNKQNLDAGAFIMKDGKLIPDERDAAMAERLKLAKKEVKENVTK